MDLKTLTPWIDQEAARIHRAYSTWLSFSDVAGHLWLWAVRNESRVDEYLGREEGEKIVCSILRAEARTYAIKERAVTAGYSIDDLTWYSPDQIRAILPDVYDYEDWQTTGGSGTDGRSKPIANATGDRLATIIDVSMAIRKLPEEHQAILLCSYAKGMTNEQIGEEYDATPEAIRKRLERIVRNIQRELGGARPTDPYEAVNGQFDTRTKGRKSMSNAAARAATDHAWDGS